MKCDNKKLKENINDLAIPDRIKKNVLNKFISDYLDGCTDADMSETYKVSERTIRAWLKELRDNKIIPYRNELDKSEKSKNLVKDKFNKMIEDEPKNTANVSKAELIKLLNIHKSRTAVSRELGISYSEVSDLVEYYHILDNKTLATKLNMILKDLLKDVGVEEPQIKIVSSGTSIILLLSDWHVGKIVKDEDGNVMYNTSVFKKRVNVLIKQILKLLDRHLKSHLSIEEFVIFAVGDFANGEGIYPTQAYEQEEAPPKQVMIAVEAFIKIIRCVLGRGLPVTFYGVYGNHGRCHSKDTKLLTIDGYKDYTQLNIGDLIPTWNTDLNKLEMKPIKTIHIYDEKNIITFRNKTSDISVTNDHIMLKYNEYKKEYERKSVCDIKNLHTNSFPTNINSNNKDYDISDNMLRLIGWILTDGRVHDTNLITLYQSKLDGVNTIRYLLRDLQLEYTESQRNRQTTQICGTTLLHKPKISYEFNILSNSAKIIKSILPERNIQKWMYKLSDRQVKILKESIICGDGTIKKQCDANIKGLMYKRKPEEVIYGQKQFLQNLQGLFVTHGINCSLNKNCRDGYYLQIRKSNNQYVYNNNVKEEIYNDKVWCVTVDNHTIFTEKNGKPLISGNSGKDADPEANWDLMIYRILDFWKQVEKPDNFYIKYSEREYLDAQVRNWVFHLRHKAYYQDETAAGDSKFKGWKDLHNANVIVSGHYHHWAVNERKIMGGSLCGQDNLSERMATSTGEPAQVIWAVTDKYSHTNLFPIRVKQNEKEEK